MSKKLIRRVPKYRKHAHSGRAFVELNGSRYYLGPYDDPQTYERYQATIAEWIANGCCVPVAPDRITVVELCVAYWRHVSVYYVHTDGTPTRTLDAVKQAIKPLRELYGRREAVGIGPMALRAVRQTWIDRGLARKTVNEYTAQVKRLFKWAASMEMIPAGVYQALTTVEGLRAGRSSARDTESVKPVPRGDIEAVITHLNAPLAAMIRLQVLTAARPGEIVGLRVCDVERSDDVWRAEIAEHKMAYKGSTRTLLFGPRAQSILRSFIVSRPHDAHLFSPRDAETDRHAKATQHRRPNQKPNVRKTSRRVGDRYTVDSYRRAIRRACQKAGVQPWTPHRLRHTAATEIREAFGLEAAQRILGHARADVTQIYAASSEAHAMVVAKERG